MLEEKMKRSVGTTTPMLQFLSYRGKTAKRTWIKVVRLYLKKRNLFEDLAQDRLEWRNRILISQRIYV